MIWVPGGSEGNFKDVDLQSFLLPADPAPVAPVPIALSASAPPALAGLEGKWQI